ncbi:MAG: aconitate hydratase [Alphaproteobacteria bacterium]|nr:aconitate hydratase [Alphaproteobacteria bacterium]
MATRPENLARKLIARALADGDMTPGAELRLRADQVLLQDATSTLTMLALEAMGLDRIKVDLACQYVDHNLIQADFKNPDDHLFLQSAARRFGVHFSRPGNGISHPVHMERLGRPGRFLVGADSHTPAAGSLGMLAIGAGSVEVATVMAGEPLSIRMPEIMGVKLTGQLPDWVSAKDVILEMLRRHSVKGGVGKIIEYHGPGIDGLSAMDRHVICNMGTELGATTSVFPADEAVRRFLAYHGREGDFEAVSADQGCGYDVEDEIDLSALEPLIATPGSPDNVVPVREVAGEPVYQAYIGSSANPGYRDFAVPAAMVEGRQVDAEVSFDINPPSRQVLMDLMRSGALTHLIQAGGRLHQAGCNGCMGMGQAPASGKNSLRTVPRNFPGRSGNADDRVWLCSPETATAAALTGRITDPRDLGMDYPRPVLAETGVDLSGLLEPPPPPHEARRVEIVHGPNIAQLPPIAPPDDALELPVLLKMGDNVSTDTINPAGAEVMPFRANVQKIAEFSFRRLDESYVARAKETRESTGHALVAGINYGQGSSREHAALAPQWLGLRLVVVKSFARIHEQNLVNAGVLALGLDDAADYEKIEAGDTLAVDGIHEAVVKGREIVLRLPGKGIEIAARHNMSPRQVEIFLSGGLINWFKARLAGPDAGGADAA